MKSELVKNIQKAAQNGKYAIRPHAINHMLADEEAKR